MRRISGISVRFLVLSLLLLGCFSILPVQRPFARAVAAVAGGMLQRCWQRPVVSEITDTGSMRLATVSSDGTSTASAELPTLLIIRNVPLFVAVVVAASPTWRRRLVATLLLGVAVMLALDSLVVAGLTWNRLGHVVGIPPTLTYQALVLFTLYYGTGGMIVAPIFLGAVVALALHEPAGGGLAPALRDDPCPCGSARKYKRCCGR